MPRNRASASPAKVPELSTFKGAEVMAIAPEIHRSPHCDRVADRQPDLGHGAALESTIRSHRSRLQTETRHRTAALCLPENRTRHRRRNRQRTQNPAAHPQQPCGCALPSLWRKPQMGGARGATSGGCLKREPSSNAPPQFRSHRVRTTRPRAALPFRSSRRCAADG